MDIYPFPPRLAQNPYLDDLYGALPPEFRVDRRSPRRSWWRMLFGGGSRVLHLHFYDALVQHPQRLVCLMRAWGWVLLLWCCRLCGVSIIWTAHNLTPHECFHPDIAAWTTARVIGVCAAVITHQHTTKASLRERHPRHDLRIVVIPHGHRSEPFGPLPSRSAARAALGLDPERPILLFLGLIRRYKGLETLIDAMELLPHALLIVAGHPSDRRYLSEIHQRSARRVNISLHPHYVTDHEAAQRLAAADALVLPYSAITTSGMLVAAQAAGVCCIVPNVPTVTETVRDGVNGFVFRSGDAASLASAVERLLTHPDRTAVAAAARATQAPHTWPVVADAHAALYRRLGEHSR